MPNKKTKTPEYTKKAVAKYQAKFYRVNINFDPKYKKILSEAAESEGESMQQYIKNAVDMRLYGGAAPEMEHETFIDPA